MTQSVLQRTSIKFPWMIGKQNDLIYFLVPALVALFVYSYAAVRPGSLDWLALTLSVIYVVNIAHAAATYFHFCDKRNRQYYFSTGKQRFKFLGLPLLIVTLSVVGGFVYWQLVALAYLIWSIPHLCQQNVGILTLYHNHGRGEAIVNRDLEVKNIQLSGLFYSVVGVHRLWLAHTPMATFSSFAVALVFIVFAVTTALYLLELIVQVRRGAYINAPALFFWFVSITYFVPLTFINNSAIMLTLPSFLHWVQYIGLNYVMVKRKYSTDQAEFLPWPSAGAVRSFVLFCTVFVTVQYGIFITCKITMTQQNLVNTWSCLFLGIGMVHYLLDGFIWKFREPYNRQAMLPYLISSAEA